VGAVGRKAEGRKKRFERSLSDPGGRDSNILLDRAPRQESRFLKDHTDSTPSRSTDQAVEFSIEACDNSEDRRLSAP